MSLFFNFEGEVVKENKKNHYNIQSNYNFEKINNLYRNFDTLSFLDLLTNYDNLLNNGYNNSFLKQSLHTMLSLPFFYF